MGLFSRERVKGVNKRSSVIFSKQDTFCPKGKLLKTHEVNKTRLRKKSTIHKIQQPPLQGSKAVRTAGEGRLQAAFAVVPRSGWAFQ